MTRVFPGQAADAVALEAFDQSVVLSLVKHERRPCGVREAHDMPDEDDMIARVLMALGAPCASCVATTVTPVGKQPSVSWNSRLRNGGAGCPGAPAPG